LLLPCLPLLQVTLATGLLYHYGFKACSGISSYDAAAAFVLQVTLATDLLYHWAGREATATVGYDVTLRQARLQGKIDSAGAPCGLI
jgi:mitochondrial import receptor subunit TOM40